MNASIHYVAAWFGLSILCIACNGQTPSGVKTSQKPLPKSELIGGGCDGCELMFVGMPLVVNQMDGMMMVMADRLFQFMKVL